MKLLLITSLLLLGSACAQKPVAKPRLVLPTVVDAKETLKLELKQTPVMDFCLILAIETKFTCQLKSVNKEQFQKRPPTGTISIVTEKNVFKDVLGDCNDRENCKIEILTE